MSSENEQQICTLCDKVVMEEDARVAKSRAIESFIKASVERKDRKHLQMRGYSSLIIHKNCHTMYTRESNIKRVVKAKKEAISKKRRKINSDVRAFDFSIDCFFCGEPAKEYVNNRRCIISFVQSDKVRERILVEIIRKQLDQNNESIQALRVRLEGVSDLAAVGARYHKACCVKFYSSRPTHIVGRPITNNTSQLVEHIKNHICENLKTCQFSIKQILSTFDGEVPTFCRLKSILVRNFGDELSIYQNNEDLILCFRDAGENVPTPSWFSSRCPNDEGERQRIVEMAANIVYQDIRSKYYDTELYKDSSNFLDEATSDTPTTLSTFLNTLMKRRTRYSKIDNDVSDKQLENKITTMAHILISSVRPRQFLSPVKLGLSSMLHKKYGSKDLIDSLSCLGLCSSYSETLLYESFIANKPENYNLKDEPILQFIDDGTEDDIVEADEDISLQMCNTLNDNDCDDN